MIHSVGWERLLEIIIEPIEKGAVFKISAIWLGLIAKCRRIFNISKQIMKYKKIFI